MQKELNVVGAVILRSGKVYCVQRGGGGTLPGAWEFPGGKIEVGEDAKTALAREIKEELRCRVVVGDKVTDTSHVYDFGTVHLSTYYCELIGEEPTLTEHEKELWADPVEMSQLNWAPADVPAVEQVIAYLLRGA